MAISPNVTIDDGADLTVEMHNSDGNMSQVYGGTEETTTGVVRLPSYGKKWKTKIPNNGRQ